MDIHVRRLARKRCRYRFLLCHTDRTRNGTLFGDISDMNVQATGIADYGISQPVWDTDDPSRRFAVPLSSISRDVIDDPS